MGTTFAPGQMAQLQTDVNIAVATALPKVAAKFEPKTVLKALGGRGEIFAGHIEAALEQTLSAMIKSAFALAPLGDVVVTLTQRHDPDAFYRTRSGLYVFWDDFRSRIVAKAKASEAGATFKVSRAELTRDLVDAEIESSLPKAHIFDETTVCAVIAGLIAGQANGEGGVLKNNGRANLFYTSPSVVRVYWRAGCREWGVDACERCDGRWWRAGDQLFSPAN